MDDLFPNFEQRFCVRHFYNNFRKRYPGKMLKEIIWKAAKSTYSQVWEREIRGIRLTSENAYLHMMKTLPRYWVKPGGLLQPRESHQRRTSRVI